MLSGDSVACCRAWHEFWDKHCWGAFAAWVGFDPAHHGQDGQSETLGHMGGGLDRTIINDEGQQQWIMTFDVMKGSEWEKT